MGLQMAFRSCKLNTNRKGLLKPYPPLPRHAQPGLGQMGLQSTGLSPLSWLFSTWRVSECEGRGRTKGEEESLRLSVWVFVGREPPPSPHLPQTE